MPIANIMKIKKMLYFYISMDLTKMDLTNVDLKFRLIFWNCNVFKPQLIQYFPSSIYLSKTNVVITARLQMFSKMFKNNLFSNSTVYLH